MDYLFDRRIFLSALVLLAVVSLSACDFGDRKQAYFDKGVSLFEAGDDARARIELKNVLQIDEKYAPGWYWLGRVEEREGDFRRAFADYNRAVELDPAFVPARVRRGHIFVLANDIDAARTDAEAAVKLLPSDPDALMLQAAVLIRSDDAAGAEEIARKVLELQPGNAGASAMLGAMMFERGDKTAAIELLQKGVEANPDVSALQLLLGGYYDQTGNVEGAIELLTGLVAANPDNNGFRSRLAIYLVQQGRSDEAEKVLRDALNAAPSDLDRQKALIELIVKNRGVDAANAELVELRKANPDNLSLHFLQAGLARASKQADAAEAAYREIIVASGGQGPDAIKARNALAAMLAEEREEEAGQLIEEVLAESPAEPDALQLRAALAVRRGDHDQAIGDLRTVLREYPDRVAAQRMIGQAHAAKGESALAQDAFEKAIAMAPTKPLAYLQLAELRVRNGDNEGALLTLETLLEKVPDNEAAQQAIAKIQFSSRDWNALGDTAERIRKTRPAHPLGYYLNGLVLQRQGDQEGAVADFEKALEISPKAVEPMIALARSQLALGKADEAAASARKVLDDNPNNVVALNLLADVYAVSGETGKARAAYEEAIRFHPKSPRAYGRLAQMEEAQGNAEVAAAVLERGAAATNRNAALVFQTAVVLERSGDFTAAIAKYEEVLKQYPNADVVANNLAVLLATRTDGQPDLDRALELAQRFADSDVPEYLDTIGWVRYLRGEYQAALPLLERAVAEKASRGELQYHLGMTYLKLGDETNARSHLTIAAESENFTDQAAARAALDALGGEG